MKKITTILLVLFVHSFIFQSCSSDDAIEDSGSSENLEFTQNADSTEAEEILSLINTERQSQSLEPMQINATAESLAIGHVKVTAGNDELSIDGNGERKLELQNTENAAIVVELNARFYTPEELFNRWMDNSSHRAILLGTSYTNIGIGVAQNSRGENYYTTIIFRERN